MLGFYDYTVILTYLSMLASTSGIIFCLNGIGHPYIGMFFLMFCGLCDAFDGKIARTKKDRTEQMKKFGIQIDSLSDLVAFGVLPACIGIAMMRCSIYYETITTFKFLNIEAKPTGIKIVVTLIAIFYTLAAMIRLAYFNVLEEERQETETTVRKTYLGLPVTSAALVFPTVLLLHIFLPLDFTFLYFIFMILVGFLFISKIKVKKPTMKGILIMIAIGAIEAAALIFVLVFLKKN